MPAQKNGRPRGNSAQDPDKKVKDRPVRVIHVRNLRANIWANSLDNCSIAYNVTFDRLWKDDDEVNETGEVVKKGDWRQSQSFGKDDLLLLRKIADFAHTWIYKRIQDENREQTF